MKVQNFQPGFLVFTYNPELGERPSSAVLPEDICKELWARGFFGGVILSAGITVESLTDEELEARGLQRIAKP